MGGCLAPSATGPMVPAVVPMPGDLDSANETVSFGWRMWHTTVI
jgi:hypothetical protein